MTQLPVDAVITVLAMLLVAGRQRVRRAFKRTGAYSPDKAIAYEPSWLERRHFKHLLNKGVVVEAQPGRYYADAAKVAEYSQRHRKFGLAIVAGALVLMTATRGLSRLWSD
jgi:aspartyl aminopeptidase